MVIIDWEVGFMEFVNAVPGLISAVGGLVVALSAAGLIKKLTDFIDKIQV